MKILRMISILLEWFVGISAIAGGYVVAASNGKGVDLSTDWLSGSLGSYLIPGIILAVVIGGTQVIAALAETMKSSIAHEASATAALSLLIWFFIELYILKHTNWLQILYFAIGVLILIFLLLRMKYEKSRIHNL
jgi:hypothetical protein